jgi:hypothetical protein
MISSSSSFDGKEEDWERLITNKFKVWVGRSEAKTDEQQN